MVGLITRVTFVGFPTLPSSRQHAATTDKPQLFDGKTAAAHSTEEATQSINRR